jgi:hypothetical protein
MLANCLLKGVAPENIRIVVTHDHSDHKNLIPHLANWVTKEWVVKEAFNKKAALDACSSFFALAKVDPASLSSDEDAVFLRLCGDLLDCVIQERSYEREVCGAFRALSKEQWPYHIQTREIIEAISPCVAWLAGIVAKIPKIGEEQILYGYRASYDDCHTFLSNALPECNVIPIRPNKYRTFGAVKEHEANLIVGVDYEGRRILLPGDADCSLLTLLENCPEDGFNEELFCGVDVMLLPHHGSAAHGELLWFNYIERRSGKPVLVIISSNAADQHNLPSEFTRDLTFSSQGCVCHEHELSTRKLTRDSFPHFETILTSKAIFTTRDVLNHGTGGFYRVLITRDGVQMASGLESRIVYQA